MYQAINRGYYNEEKYPAKWYFGEVDDPLFSERMTVTVRALRAVKRLCTSRIALIGGIAPGFNDLYFDERKLLRLFPGSNITSCLNLKISLLWLTAMPRARLRIWQRISKTQHPVFTGRAKNTKCAMPDCCGPIGNSPPETGTTLLPYPAGPDFRIGMITPYALWSPSSMMMGFPRPVKATLSALSAC